MAQPDSNEEARLRAALRHRIARRYATRTTLLTIGGMSLPFTRVADPDRVLDEVAAEEDRLERVSGRRATSDQLHLPYWAELWDSAIGMGAHLIRSSLPADCSVLDLGCGMGLAGTVAAALGARVLFADLEPPALLFARLNSLPYAQRYLRRRPDIRKRWFGVRRWAQRVRTRRLNWRTDRLDERFDFILGADILYERKQWDYLEPFWRAHLAPGGTVLLGEPGRQTGDLFVDWITARGWRLMRHAEIVETREQPIRLFELHAGE